MATNLNFCTISSVTFIEEGGDNYLDNSLQNQVFSGEQYPLVNGNYKLVITPDIGYIISTNDITIDNTAGIIGSAGSPVWINGITTATLPDEVSSVYLENSGTVGSASNTVIATIILNSNFTMPFNDLDIEIDFDGTAKEVTVETQQTSIVVTLNGTNYAGIGTNLDIDDFSVQANIVSPFLTNLEINGSEGQFFPSPCSLGDTVSIVNNVNIVTDINGNSVTLPNFNANPCGSFFLSPGTNQSLLTTGVRFTVSLDPNVYPNGVNASNELLTPGIMAPNAATSLTSGFFVNENGEFDQLTSDTDELLDFNAVTFNQIDAWTIDYIIPFLPTYVVPNVSGYVYYFCSWLAYDVEENIFNEDLSNTIDIDIIDTNDND